MSIYLEIFLIGLLGSTHCIGMCGGFVAMYSLRRTGGSASLSLHALYTLGRITTYALIGGLLGAVGSFSSSMAKYKTVPGAVLLFAGLIMVLMGLNMAGIFGKRGLFETDAIASIPVFRRSLHATLAIESQWGVYLFGVLLGFLPCGLLYPLFIQAAVSGGFSSGLATMIAFGFGTMPAMMAFGWAVTRFSPRLKLLLYRIAAGLIVLLGLRTVLRGMSFLGWIPAGRFW
ncbi:MAG TPA: sulfite exporter TauE/SafE family protein [Nitrospirota bacterium]|nr:sulfite exporter TauE/SafE family protein [Nitrospirota bacterium]